MEPEKRRHSIEHLLEDDEISTVRRDGQKTSRFPRGIHRIALVFSIILNLTLLIIVFALYRMRRTESPLPPWPTTVYCKSDTASISKQCKTNYRSTRATRGRIRDCRIRHKSSSRCVRIHRSSKTVSPYLTSLRCLGNTPRKMCTLRLRTRVMLHGILSQKVRTRFTAFRMGL